MPPDCFGKETPKLRPLRILDNDRRTKLIRRSLESNSQNRIIRDSRNPIEQHLAVLLRVVK